MDVVAEREVRGVLEWLKVITDWEGVRVDHGISRAHLRVEACMFTTTGERIHVRVYPGEVWSTQDRLSGGYLMGPREELSLARGGWPWVIDSVRGAESQLLGSSGSGGAETRGRPILVPWAGDTIVVVGDLMGKTSGRGLRYERLSRATLLDVVKAADAWVPSSKDSGHGDVHPDSGGRERWGWG